jgi:hypothetical protein
VEQIASQRIDEVGKNLEVGQPVGIYTLCVDNYAPEITRLTFPFMRYFAEKIGADFNVITERKFPGWPHPCEKWQLYELSERHERRTTVFFDADVLIHPETVDFTQWIPRDHCANNGCDMANVRVNYDRYFLRDGRNIGTCGWLIVASDWTRDIFQPPDDLTLEECIARCHPILDELRPAIDHPHAIVDKAHLVDDFIMSRNVARYGLKYVTLGEVLKKVGFEKAAFFQHPYMITNHEKTEQLKEVLFGSPDTKETEGQWCPRCSKRVGKSQLDNRLGVRSHYCGWKVPHGLAPYIDDFLDQYLVDSSVAVTFV